MTSQEKQNLFMASISHELRTPLTSILGYGELLEETSLDSKQQEYLGRMLHSSQYLLSLVEDFMDIVKLEKNGIKLEPQEVRLHTILSECADIIKTNLQQNVFFDLNIPFLDYTILADACRIKQVILNILSNSAKFTQNGTIKFHVTNIEDQNDKVKIEIRIEDTGSGISPEIQRALFDPFITSDSTQGFGLGLYISKEIIKLMEGEIIFRSKEGEGSTFTLSFIVKKAKNKISKQLLSGKKIIFLSQTYYAQQEELKKCFNTFNASLVYYESNDDSLKEIIEHVGEYDMIIFNMHPFSSAVSEVISTLKVIQPHIKRIGLIGENTNLPKSNFDKLIQGSLNPRDIVFELEAFSANEHIIHTGSMDFSYLRVLVVEDVAMSYEYIQQMLSVSFSINCDLATNGKEAVEKVKANTYDVIFMDIRMPVMNGYDAAKAIREFNTNIAIIYMSADVYAKDTQKGKEAELFRMIRKPLDKNEIKEVFLDLRSSQIKNHISRVPYVMEEAYTSDKITTYDSLELKKKAYRHLKQLFNDELIISSLIEKAVKSIEKYLTRIRHNKIEQNTAALVEDIHAIKGVLANLGLKEASMIAGEIQKHFQSGELQEAYRRKNEFIQNIGYFVSELKKDID